MEKTSSIYYNITEKSYIIFHNAKWKIIVNKFKLDKDIYQVNYSLLYLNNKIEWILISEFNLSFPGEGKYIPNTPFYFQILNVYLNTNFQMTSEVKITINEENDIMIIDGKNDDVMDIDIKKKKKKKKKKRKIPVYIDPITKKPNKRKKESESESEEEELQEIKKQKTIEIKEIDILLVGLRHDDVETYYYKHFKDDMSFHLTQFLSEKIISDKNTKIYRKPFLSLWEYTNINLENEIILLSELNGKNSHSFNVRNESLIFSYITYLSASYILFLYPAQYDPQTEAPVDTPINVEYIQIENSQKASFGEEHIIPPIDYFGSIAPYAIKSGWNTITDLWLLYIDSKNQIKIFEQIIKKEYIEIFWDKLNSVTEHIIKNNTKRIDKITAKIVDKFIAENDFDDDEDEDNKKQRIIKDLLIYYSKDKGIFYNKTQKLILYHYYFSRKMNLKDSMNEIKEFIFLHMKILFLDINKNHINLEKSKKLSINLDNIDKLNFKDDAVLDSDYYSKIYENITTAQEKNFSTLYFNNFFSDLKENGVFINPSEVLNSYIDVQLRNLPTIASPIYICKKNNLNRFIVNCGDAHIRYFVDLLNKENLKNTSKMKFNIDLATLTLISNFKLTKNDKKDDQINKLWKLLNYCFIMERIDQWLFKTEYKISWTDFNLMREKEIKQTEIKDKESNSKLHLPNFEEMVEFIGELEDGDYDKDIIKCIRVYFGIVQYTNYPYYHGNLSLNSASYFEIDLEDEILAENLFKFIPKTNIKLRDKYSRTPGQVFNKYYYYKDEVIENTISLTNQYNNVLCDFIKDMINVAKNKVIYV